MYEKLMCAFHICYIHMHFAKHYCELRVKKENDKVFWSRVARAQDVEIFSHTVVSIIYKSLTSLLYSRYLFFL